jgi:hypothetical protein
MHAHEHCQPPAAQATGQGTACLERAVRLRLKHRRRTGASSRLAKQEEAAPQRMGHHHIPDTQQHSGVCLFSWVSTLAHHSHTTGSVPYAPHRGLSAVNSGCAHHTRVRSCVLHAPNSQLSQPQGPEHHRGGAHTCVVGTLIPQYSHSIDAGRNHLAAHVHQCADKPTTKRVLISLKHSTHARCVPASKFPASMLGPDTAWQKGCGIKSVEKGRPSRPCEVLEADMAMAVVQGGQRKFYTVRYKNH